MNKLGTFAALKNYQLWDVAIGNNYYNGRYADYNFKPYPVIAGSAEEARETVLKYADSVLADLKSKQRYNSQRRLLPARRALSITEQHLGRTEQKIIRSTSPRKWKTMLSPQGWIQVQLKYSKITDCRKIDETGNT